MAHYFFRITVRRRGAAWPHAVYLQRLRSCGGRRGGKEEVEAWGCGNMPDWAGEHCLDFWKASDDFERVNGTSYHEYLFSIPRELSPKGRQQLVDDVIASEMERFPYMYVIHRKTASDGLPQPHCHLMFSSRMRDNIERSPKQFFKRFNRKQPEKGGCEKDTMHKQRWKQTAECLALRKRVETCMNRALEREGLKVRVSCKSLKEQGIDRAPEPQCGLASWHKYKDAILERREIAFHFDLTLGAKKSCEREVQALDEVLDADMRERCEAAERSCREARRQSPEQAALEARERELEEAEDRLYAKIRSKQTEDDGVTMLFQPDPQDLFARLDFQFPPKRLLQRRATYRRQCAELAQRWVAEREAEATDMFFKLVLKIADRSRWTRWACSLQREMTRLCGDNFDFWTDADRQKAIDRRSALLDAADRMTCLRRPDALVTALAEHRADDAVKLARGYLMELRQNVLLADSVLGLQREKEGFVERRSEYLRELHGLVRMEVGLEPEDALFGELSRKFHSRYLARMHYRKEALRREDQERERIRERERSRVRTVELTR